MLSLYDSKASQRAFFLDYSYLPRKRGMNLNGTQPSPYACYVIAGRRLGLN